MNEWRCIYSFSFVQLFYSVFLISQLLSFYSLYVYLFVSFSWSLSFSLWLCVCVYDTVSNFSLYRLLFLHFPTTSSDCQVYKYVSTKHTFLVGKLSYYICSRRVVLIWIHTYETLFCSSIMSNSEIHLWSTYRE